MLDALDRLLRQPDVSDAELVGLVGPPSLPSGCTVEGDLTALMAGRPADLVFRAHLERIDDSGVVWIEITRLPPDTASSGVLNAIVSRAQSSKLEERRPDLNDEMIPMADLEDSSRENVQRFHLRLKSGADVDDALAKIRTVWGVETKLVARLPGPLATLLRDHVASDPTGVATSTDELRSLITA